MGSGIALLGYAGVAELGLTPLQSVVLVLLAWDIVGGPPALTSASTNRWYMGKSRPYRVIVVAVHFAQPLIATVAFRAGIGYFLAVWLPAFAIAVAVTYLEPPSTRSVAMGLVTVAIVGHLLLLSPPHALVWIGPVFLLKIGYGFPVNHTGTDAAG